MNILALKLVTGEEVIGELESQSESEFVLVNPVGIAVVRNKQTGEPQVGFSPCCQSMNSQAINLGLLPITNLNLRIQCHLRITKAVCVLIIFQQAIGINRKPLKRKLLKSSR